MKHRALLLSMAMLALAFCVSAGAAERALKIVGVSVSSVESNRPEMRGENAADGNAVTRWSSDFSDPQWIQLDLGTPQEISKMTIDWENAFARKYEVLVSPDAATWKKVHTEDGSNGGRDEITLDDVTARYVRILCLERATAWGNSILEIALAGEVKDDGLPPDAPTGLSAIRGDEAVFLTWNENKEEDLQQYNVYRSDSGTNRFERVQTVQESRYVDATAPANVECLYHVTAMDLGGRESDPSRETAGSVATASTRDFYPIPACAWRHDLGDVPAKCISTSPDRGVAMGGFGAGSFMYTITGSFGPFQTFDSTLYKPVWLDAAAFHVYEKIGDAAPTVRCLATSERMKPAWNQLKTGEGVYYALQPKGWSTYSAFQTDISQKFFSPIIPFNYKETSYPVGIWTFRLHNPTTNSAELGLMLTFPDVYVGETLAENRFTNALAAGGDIQGVVLKSQKGLGEWCLATRADAGVEVSSVTSWNGEGDGKDIWNAFRNNGVLDDIKPDRSQSAAALAVKVTVKPGETVEVPIVISWDFPVVRFHSGTEWWKKYTEYFDRGGTNSFAMASEALKNRADWETQLDAWMKPVINCDQYPDWLKCAAFNELYYNQFGGIFYEAGLKSGHKEEFMGLHPEDHKHYEMESPVYTSADTLDVRHYSSIIYARFWPEIERDTLKVFADGTLYFKFPKPVPVGLVPHDVGDPKKCDPFFLFDVYRHDLPNMLYWKDLSSKFVQQCWRYYALTGDKEFLAYVWPACKAVFEFMKSTDQDGDRLPDNSGSDNTYDAWGLYGTSLLCGGLWVGALECLEPMAKAMNDTAAGEIGTWLVEAKENLDRELWMPDKGYYRMDTRGKFPNAVMSDGLNGQLYCRRFGLDDILPADRMKAQLERTYALCVKPLKDYDGDGVGDIGAVNAVQEDSSLLGTLQSDEVWTGTSYFLASLMVDAGMRDEALRTAYGVYYITYINRETAFWFNTPESWRVPTMVTRPSNPEQYQRPRAVWELLFAISDPYKK